MITAFNDAAGRSNPTAVEVGAGAIGGLAFAPGIYKCITISGSSTDNCWHAHRGIGKAINLSSGALAKNIVWVVSGKVTINSGAVFNGVILGATSVALNTGATLHGRILAQTAVTLQQAIVSS
ncbi:hypothetical protein BDZ97DRAFT_1836236 [Flammula alnicola]|nr:hypothetical protein BDZ97DRAFT_1836236 [Flammula alnicola]